MNPLPALFVFALLAVVIRMSPAHSQLVNPLTDPASSGISIQLEPWITIPLTTGDTTSPKRRINHVKPCPGDLRLFCNNLNGSLWSIANESATSATLFLEIAEFFPNFIRTSGLGTGFASFAFHPEFAAVGMPGYGKFYTAHSENATGGNVDFEGPASAATDQIGTLVEWTMDDPSDNTITPSNQTHRTLLRIGFPFNYHDLQEIAFNPTLVPGDEDYGCLFVCVGDGGSLVVNPIVPDNIGRVDSPLGAIHRIVPVLASATVNGLTGADFILSSNGNYHIPSGPLNGNPHVAFADPTPGDGFPVVREMYANGFRNPHRVTWDSGGSHKMLCGNIGETQIEEIELVEKGANHGWPAREGSFLFKPFVDTTRVYPLSPSPDASGIYRYPVAQYDHSAGDAVVGGMVYRGTALPELVGKYICGDIAKGKMWIADEVNMSLAASTATGGSPAALRSLGIKSGNTPTTLLAILGQTRADLRFGTDHSGEILVLSKRNGVIYQVKRDSAAADPPPAGGMSDWSPLYQDLENGSLAGISSNRVGTSIQIVNDPAEGAANRVLRVQNPGTDTGFASSFPITPIPDDSVATLHFRFLVPDQNHDVSFGLSDVASPASTQDFEVQMISAGNSGNLKVRDGPGEVSGFAVSGGVWYSVWAVVHNSAGGALDRWDLYVQGGAYTAPALVRAGIGFRNGTSSALTRFFIRPTASGSTHSPVYLDDVYVDVGHVNLTAPTAPDWQVVEQFESADPLAAWEIPTAAQQSSTIVTEPDGNRYFRRAASSSASDNTSAVAARALPFDVQVGQTSTTFFRFRLEGGNLNHQFGTTSQTPADAAGHTPSDFEPHLRISSASAAGGLDLYDGSGGNMGFVPAVVDSVPVPPLAGETWYKVWLVADNKGWASGGQRWQAYLQGGIYQTAVAISDNLFFHNGAEGTLSRFLSIATTGTGGVFGNDAIHIDDLFACKGVNLSDPVGRSWIPTTLVREGGMVTLSHPTRVNHFSQLYESGDLENWSPLTESIEGGSGPMSFDQAIAHPRRFFLAAEHTRRSFHPAGWLSDFSGSTLPPDLTFVSPSTSQWSIGFNVLTLNLISAQSAPVVPGMIARPGSYALVPGDWRNVDIRMTAKTLRSASVANRDVIIPFGYQDQTHFYYAHFSAKSDGTVHTVIMKVTGSQIRQIINQPPTVSPAPFTALVPTNFRVTHAATGAIAIYCDDLVTPFMTATDTAYPAGRVGFGSFDDPAEFHSFQVSGEKR